VRFEASEEIRLFRESVRATVGDWEPPREPELGTWLDDRDDALASRLEAAGWADLDAPGLGEAAVAGGMELGRAVAPLSLVDEETLGAPLAVGGRARHAGAAEEVAVPLVGGGLGRARPLSEPVPEATLDGTGTVRVELGPVVALDPDEAVARLGAWHAATLGYAAGLAARALERAVEHARTREQFGAPLASLPAVQGGLARAALAVEGMTLVAWASARADRLPAGELLWACAACSDVAATAQQVHGALGFALETGLHRFHRRAASLTGWSAAVCEATR
jgi:hypothetical protein